MPEQEGNQSSNVASALAAIQGTALSQETQAQLNAMLESKAQAAQAPEGAQAQPATAPVDGVATTDGVASTPPEGGTPPEGSQAQPNGVAATAPEGATLDSDFIVKSPLLGGEKNIGKPIPSEGADTSEEVKFENIESVNTFLKEKYGLSDINDIPLKLNELKEQSDTVNKLTEQISNVEQLFKIMPPSLHSAIDVFARGGDWEAELSKTMVDLTKDVKDIDNKSLVDAFAPGKVTEDDWNEFKDPEGDETVKKYVSAILDNAQKEFNGKKSAFENEKVSRIQKAKEHEESFNSSLNASVSELKVHYPDADKQIINTLSDILSAGKLNTVFYENDGTLKKDALTRLAMAQYGAELIDEYKSIATRRIETEFNERLLTRGADAPRATGGSAAVQQGQGIRPEVQAEIDRIKGLNSAR